MRNGDKTNDSTSIMLSDIGARNSLAVVFAAGYALQHFFDFLDELRKARDEGDVRFEQDINACAVAARHLMEWFRDKGVTFDEDLRPLAPAMPLDLSRLKTLHAEAMHLALAAVHSAAYVTDGMWSDPDLLSITVKEMMFEAFSAGAPNRLWVAERNTGEMVEIVREVCARSTSTGQLVDLEGNAASPFPRNPFPNIGRRDQQ